LNPDTSTRDPMVATASGPAGQGPDEAAPIGCAKDLGQAILERRKQLGYGLVEAAALCGVGTRFLFELEHGKATVEFNRALRVARRFGLRLVIQVSA